MKRAIPLSALAITISIAIAAMVSIARAEDGSVVSSPDFSQCMRASGGITSDMRACLHAEYDRLDRQLNATYRSVMRQLRTKDLRTRLLNSQRAWIWRRDYDCQLKVDNSGFKGGTAADIIYDDCRVEAVRKRIQWLRKVPANPGYLTKV